MNDIDSRFQNFVSDSPDLRTLRHTAAHMLAQALRRLRPEVGAVKTAIGPAIESGFYYDFDLATPLTDADLPSLEAEMLRIRDEALPVTQASLSRSEAANLFRQEPYKLQLLDAIPEGDPVTVYSQGEFTDLCRGPHVANTKEVVAIKLLSVAGAYWRGDERNKMLTRVYGVAYRSKADLKLHLERLRLAAEIDHRKLGRQLGIFALTDEAKGMPILLPGGIIVMEELKRYERELHRKNGYVEIRTPEIMRRHLWEVSGHWDHYSDKMYALTSPSGEELALKPMNCPGAILAYRAIAASSSLSTKAPVRLAEFGVVHRVERAGELHGLMRLAEFTQDDAHIICPASLLGEEVASVLSMIDEVYSTLGLTYSLELSTRPQSSIGSDQAWEAASSALTSVLDSAGRPYSLNEGDGAFYGPKIDVHIKDALGRTWQCATIQVDFNLPARFGLPDGLVMVHRVIYGSIERFMGILLEHFGGNLPLWLAPVHIAVIPVTSELADEAAAIAASSAAAAASSSGSADSSAASARRLDRIGDIDNFALFDSARMAALGIRVSVDRRNETVGKRVRAAIAAKVPYIIVFGEAERTGGPLVVRHGALGPAGEVVGGIGGETWKLGYSVVKDRFRLID